MAEKLPWFPLYVYDLLTDDKYLRMTWAERGVYLHLMCLQWIGGGTLRIPEGSSAQAVLEDSLGIAGAVQCTVPGHRLDLSRVLAECFPKITEGIANQRLAQVYEQQRVITEAHRRGGRKAHHQHSSSSAPAEQVLSRRKPEPKKELSLREDAESPSVDTGIRVEAEKKLSAPGKSLARRNGRSLDAVKTHLADVFTPVEGQTAARVDREQFRRAGAEFVFAYWAKKLHHPAALFDEKRETRIRRALQENRDNLSELCYVVDGVLLDPWEGRRQQDDILVIMRDRTHIEKLAGLCPGYRSGKVHPVVAHLGAEDAHAEAVSAEAASVGA